MEIRRTFWVFLAILVLSLVGAILTQARLYYRFFYICLFVIVISFLWTLISIRGYRLQRYARLPRQNVGQILLEQFELQNKLPFVRVWAGIYDRCAMTGKMGSRVLTWIGAKEERSYISYSILQRRGLYQLGPSELFSGDPLGLFQISKSFPAQQSLVILPYMVQLDKFPSPPGLLTGGRVIGRRTFEVTPQASGVREYVPGDPLNRIHWRTTMRRERLMVKEFENDPRADIWIFLDANQRIHSKLELDEAIIPIDEPFWKLTGDKKIHLPADSFEYAVSIAGSVANFFIRQGKAVGFASIGQLMTVLAPERGERQQYRILETLAYIGSEGQIDLSALVVAQAPNISRGSTVVIISTSDYPDLNLAVDPIIRRSLKPIIIILDASTFGGKRDSSHHILKMSQQNLPFVSIRYDENLKERLENGFGYVYQQEFPRWTPS